MGERDLIEWIRSRRDGRGAEAVLVGPGDDVAVLGVGGERIALATDIFVAGVHFAADAAARSVGWKALAANISDLAACGAEPVASVAAVAAGTPGGGDYCRELYLGLAEAAERYGCPVVGGDVSSAPAGAGVSVAVSVVGRFDCEPVLRSGASPGELIYVTGELGGSIAGRHLAFEPRLAEGRYLARGALARAMIDLSDGLATDLGHLCRESGVGAAVDEAAVPVSADARALAGRSGRPALEHALGDGEDFELLFTVAPGDAERLESSWPTPVPLARIGVTTERAGAIVLRDAGGGETPFDLAGYEHRLGE